MTDAEWLEYDALPGWFVASATSKVLTEAEWLSAKHPEPMLNALRDRISDRKLRLFACACCRCVPFQLADHRSRQAVEVAERFAEGLSSQAELDHARQEAKLAHFSAAERACYADAWEAARRAALFAAKGVAYPARKRAARMGEAGRPERTDLQSVRHAALLNELRVTRQTQADLLREIVGNPFRSVNVDASWLGANQATVLKIVQQIDDERSFENLSNLGDALEAAGCTETDILSHCHADKPHAPGCWVVDLLLNRT